MEKLELVKSLIEGPLADAGYRLDDVLLEKEGKMLFLRVIIDKTGFINVDDCVTACHIINPIFDEADPISEEYILDVCSKEKGCE